MFVLINQLELGCLGYQLGIATQATTTTTTTDTTDATMTTTYYYYYYTTSTAATNTATTTQDSMQELRYELERLACVGHTTALCTRSASNGGHIERKLLKDCLVPQPRQALATPLLRVCEVELGGAHGASCIGALNDDGELVLRTTPQGIAQE